MKNHDKIIGKLIDMASDHYHDGLKPDVYAATAALTFAKAMAFENNTHSADAAAFVAALETAESIVDLTHYLAQLADTEANTRQAMKTWRVPQGTKVDHKITTQPMGLFLKTIIDSQETRSLSDNANKVYQSTFDSNESDSLCAALASARASYSFVYSSAHASYRYAIEMAARCSSDADRQMTFNTAITKRLSAELNHQPIEPSFFMVILCSLTVNIVSWVLLALGLVALSLGIAGFIYPAVSSMVLNAGIGLTCATVAGASLTTVSAGILTCQFFASRQWQRDNEASRHAVEALQGGNKVKSDEVPVATISPN